MELAISLVVGLLLAVMVAAIGYNRYVRPARFRDRLGDAVVMDTPVLDRDQAPKARLVKIIQQIGEKAPISPQDAGLARKVLIAGGYRTDTAVRIYYGSKIVLGVAGLFLAIFVRGYIDNPVGRILIFFVLGGGGFFLPNLALDKIISRRQENIRFSLPDALDLLVVCMEAGLGLDQGIANVARELKITHPVISEELALVTLEMRHGKRRMEALKNLADRNGEPELRKLVATMIQADRFGTSIADALRTHSEFMRVRRRQEAEERAAKVGVKLVFPIFFFILPSMMVVAAGPGILALVKNLFPMMQSYGQ